jgi:transposase-like protein
MKALPKLTFKQFQERFPNDDACLHHIFNMKFGKMETCPCCNKKPEFKRVAKRMSYQCSQCSYQVYPMVETIFEKTTTPLTTWFHAMYLFTVTRNGVAAKELERVLDISYPTALRMAHRIKLLMTDSFADKLCGVVEMDETYLGGAQANMHVDKLNKKGRGKGTINKTAVFGMMETKGRVITKVIKEHNVNLATLKPIVKENVSKDTIIVTDGAKMYPSIGKEFKEHHVMNHETKEFARGGYTTNHMESYWSHLKRMIKGTHIHVSDQHLPKYLGEHSFRYMFREQPEKMFDIILSRIV